MAGKSDTLRERDELFSQGDLERALDLWSDDFVWEGSNAWELPDPGDMRENRRRSRSCKKRWELGTSSR